MDIKFKRFKAKKYIILLLTFVLTIGTTNIPSNAVSTTSTASTIKEVLKLESGTKDVTVKGQIVYFATTNDPNNTNPISYHDDILDIDDLQAVYGNPVIQSVIDGTTYSLYIDGLAPLFSKIGDQVEIKGTYVVENGFPMLKGITKKIVIGSNHKTNPTEVTVADLKANGLNMLGRYVKIKDVTLGAYKAFGLTKVSDATGDINIFNTSPYPAAVDEGDIIDLYAIVACYDSTIYLYAGTKEANGYNTFDNINDIEPPLLTLQDTPAEIQTGMYLYITAIAEDNRGIQKVTLDYTIGDKTVSDQVMKPDPKSNEYEYTIPKEQITEKTPQISYRITATDLTGLKTVSETRKVVINNTPNISFVSPESNERTPYNQFSISFTHFNSGSAPQCTLTLTKEGKLLYDGPIKIDSEQRVASFSPHLGTYFPGNYTATVKLKRIEDGMSTTKSWNFTLTDTSEEINNPETEAIDISGTPEIEISCPDPNETFNYKTFMILLTISNFGNSPNGTLTLTKDNETIDLSPYDDKLSLDKKLNIVLFKPKEGTLPPGNYTATYTIIRSEDGKSATKSWDFTLTE